VPSQDAQIGPSYDIYVPEVDGLIALGYTGIRVYWATSETASPSLATTLTLVSGTYDYSYNNTSGAETDWAEHCWYGATPGEGPRSTRVPVGRPRTTRLQVRQAVGRRLRLMELQTVASSASNVKFIATALIDPDASPYRYCSWFARHAVGTFAGEIRRVRDYDSAGTTTGYVPSTGEIQVGRTWGGTLGASDVVELWKPKGDEDPSAMVDEAMNRAADRMWHEEVHLFTVDDSVTEYTLPAGCYESAISSVEFAAGQASGYPDKPLWEEVGWWEVRQSSGQNVISVYRSPMGEELYSGGDIIRVTYAATPDRMDSDADYWNVPLEWAVAETALETLDILATPSGGGEEVGDADRARASLMRDVQQYRAKYMPAARMKVRGQR